MKLDKYPAQKEAIRPPLKSWTDSADVIRLVEFLRIHANQGITLCRTETGAPCLTFAPGLQKQEKDPERWAIAKIAEGLFMSAAADLQGLLSLGLLTPPTAPPHGKTDRLPVPADKNGGSFPQTKNDTAG